MILFGEPNPTPVLPVTTTATVETLVSWNGPEPEPWIALDIETTHGRCGPASGA